MPRKSGPIDDPVIAELLKRKAETSKDFDNKIRERRAQLTKSERDIRKRRLMLWGVAHFADVEKHPERRAEALATLNRAIVNEKDRAFLKSVGDLSEAGAAPLALPPDSITKQHDRGKERKNPDNR